MRKPSSRIWDVLVLWPVLYFFMAILFTGAVALLTSTAGESSTAMGTLALLGLLFFFIHVGSIVLMLVVYVYAIHALYTQTSLPPEKKRNWLILIVLFNVIAIPVLHFRYLRQ